MKHYNLIFIKKMTSDGEMIKIKVIDLKMLNNFIVYNFFI